MKPVPLNAADLIVTGAVPVDARITGSVDAVFIITFPNAKLAVLMLNAATFAAEALSCIAKLLETPPTLAVNVTACAIVTAGTVAANPALVAFAGTVTVAGTATAALLLLRPTLKPLLPAAELRVTVQASVPAPVRDAVPQEIALNAAGAAVLVPALAVLAVLLPDVLPHPEIATVTNAHANNANSLADKPSSRRCALRQHRKHELNNVLTSVDAHTLPELTEKRFE
jgi:hypothetical protein